MRKLMRKNESTWGALRRSVLSFKGEQWYQGMRRYREMQRLRVDKTRPSLVPFEERKCIFIHIPKNGGLSVSSAVFDDQIAPGHRGIQFYHAVYGRGIADYFKFAVVRNPWDRLVSAYHFLAGGGLNETDAYLAERFLAPYATFDDFVCGWMNKANAYKIMHLVPQHEYVTGFRGRLAIDYVAHLETLDQDAIRIFEKLNMEGKEIPRQNTSRRGKDFREYYTQRSRDIVAGVYEKDIAMFSYRFDA